MTSFDPFLTRSVHILICIENKCRVVCCRRITDEKYWKTMGSKPENGWVKQAAVWVNERAVSQLGGRALHLSDTNRRRVLINPPSEDWGEWQALQRDGLREREREWWWGGLQSVEIALHRSHSLCHCSEKQREGGKTNGFSFLAFLPLLFIGAVRKGQEMIGRIRGNGVSKCPPLDSNSHLYVLTTGLTVRCACHHTFCLRFKIFTRSQDLF